MSRQCIIKPQKVNNTGSAIVTVLVIVAFMTILATIMLYVSGSNFQMKVADYRTKESFYYAETPVEELREQLVEDVQEAFAKAYTASISEYSGFHGNVEDQYRQLFCEEMDKIWRTRCGTITGDDVQWKTGIEAVVQPATETGGAWTVEVIPTEKSKKGFERGEAAEEGLLILRGVEFTYVSGQGYTSIISTDFCITIPPVNWPSSDGHGNYGYSSGERSRLNFGGCVNYMNWTKK